MIPKVIHYIWLGKNPKPKLVNICINSWRDKLPDYEIIEWNENNLDLDKMSNENRFFKECRRRKMWAFMADFIRLKILFEYGGIYLDTDVQVLKDISPIINTNAIVSLEAGDSIGTGLIGAIANMDIIKTVWEFYDYKIWNTSLYTIPDIFTYIMKDNKFSNQITIYPKEYFAPFGYNEMFDYNMIKKNTYAIHWFSGSWGKKISTRIFLETKHMKNPLQKIVKALRIIGRMSRSRLKL